MDNLAELYFKDGEYDDAIRSYSSLDRFPLARLEMARIFRLQGDLDRAAESEQLAAEWLGNESLLAKVPENEAHWILEGVVISERGQKLCYTWLLLSATLYLKGDRSGAASDAGLAEQACHSQSREIRGVVRSELVRVKRERPELAELAGAYSLDFLSGGFRSR